MPFFQSRAKEPPTKPPPAPDGYLRLTRDLWISLVLVMPLLVVYQAGLMMLDFQIVNGVDFVTRLVYRSHGLKGMVILNLCVVAAFLAAIIRLENRGRFRLSLYVPLLCEASVYAGLVLANLVPFVIESSPLCAVTGRHATGIVLSIGAGVYEEIVFRLFLIAVLVYVLDDLFGLGRRSAVAYAIVLSSCLFALAHHVGPFGEPFEAPIFCFRMLAGLVFAAIYKLRSFAVAVYTHAAYDLYVMVL